MNMISGFLQIEEIPAGIPIEVTAIVYDSFSSTFLKWQEPIEHAFDKEESYRQSLLAMIVETDENSSAPPSV